MGIRGIGIEAFVGHLVHGVHAVGVQSVFYSVELVADYKGFEFYAQFVGKHAAFCQEFEAYVGHMAFVVFAVDYDIVVVCHNGCVFSLWYGWR